MARAKKIAPKKSAARKRAAQVRLPDALAEAAWREADQGLADALSDLAEAQAALEAGDDARLGEAMLLLTQALNRAARRRGLTRFGVVGASEPFALHKHELIGAGARKPKRVRIVAQGIARGGESLVKARAKAVRARKQT